MDCSERNQLMIDEMCQECGKTFTARRNLLRHLKIHSGVKPYGCNHCDKRFARNSDLTRHQKMHLNEKPFKCGVCQKGFIQALDLQLHFKVHEKHNCQQCNETFKRKSDLLHHVGTTHPIVSVKRKATIAYPPNKRVKRAMKSALNVFTSTTLKPSEESSVDLITFFKEMKPQIKQKLEEEMQEKTSIKWYGVVQVALTRTTQEGDEESITSHFRSKCSIELMEHTMEEHINEAIMKISKSFEEFIQRGSGWTLEKILYLDLYTAKYHPLAASSYIPLPVEVSTKKAVLNIKNEDQKCLVWCLLAHKMNLDYKSHAERVKHYSPYEAEIKLGDIQCPVPILKIPKVERLNDLRINVFGFQEKEIIPLYISPREDVDVINLLYISNEKAQHYCLIRDMSRLLGDRTHYNGRTYYCFRCLHRFMEEKNLKEHEKYCKDHSPQKIIMPALEKNILVFDKYEYQLPIPYIIYADFESLIVPISTLSTAEPNPDISFTQKMNNHKPCGYAYIIIGPDGKSVKPIQVYRGEDAVDHFLQSIVKEKEALAPKLLNVIPMHMTDEDKQHFQNATICFLCKKELNDDRVRDHDHFSGKFRGALHSQCNLKYRKNRTIPVVFHNLKHYDGHLIMHGLGKIKDHQISVTANNMEKYISFSLIRYYNNVKVSMQFIDSLQFMPFSLEKLVGDLNPAEFKILKENFSRSTNLQLLLRKGIYPYEHMSSFAKFEETALPPIKAFYSSLTGDTISEEDYAHAHTVWKEFNICNLGQYHDLYVKSDVLLLADVFQNFRKLCQKYYELDCAHMMTAPGLAWQASLKMCEQPLELLTNIDHHLFIEGSVRGGISMITKRWAKANNHYLADYDASKPNTYIMYLDANNLYGWAMSQCLPYAAFQWMSPEDINEAWILSIQDDSQEGYILEVDLEYPQELHDLHNDYPLAPEKKEITEDIISPYSKNLMESMGMASLKNVKLTPNLNDKQNYVVYYRNLKLYLSLGLKLKKVHKVMKFQQKAWLKPYIEFNTEKRKQASSAFEKDFFKLMNNAVYGKTMENVRKHVDIQLVVGEKKAKKMVAAPTFHAFKIFTDDLVGIERKNVNVILDKPIYVGFVILELSKLLMYDFHYNIIKKQYDERASLLFTDTDSLTYEIQTQDIYEDMKSYRHIYDTSEYPTDHPLYSIANKKKIGCFKDELNSKPAIEFIGLRAKMYSLQSVEDEKKTAKGVSKTVIKKKLKHRHYKECLTECGIRRDLQSRIQSENHQLYTIKQNKVSLSPFDDKRYILEDGFHTLAYGHYAISHA